MHHRFDESPDDYDMDMDQRTRLLGRGGRIILLGNGGTENDLGHDETDVDMDRVTEVEEVSEDADEEAVQRNPLKNGDVRSEREGTPAPAAAAAAASSGNDVPPKAEDTIMAVADEKLAATTLHNEDEKTK